MKVIYSGIDENQFEVSASQRTIRRLARIAAGDECVAQLWVSVAGDDSQMGVTLTYDVTEHGAREIVDAWLTASATLPEVVL